MQIELYMTISRGDGDREKGRNISNIIRLLLAVEKKNSLLFHFNYFYLIQYLVGAKCCTREGLLNFFKILASS